MLPRAAILALVAAVACALQITAAQRVPNEDKRAPLKEYTKERDKKYDEDFMPKKSGFTYDWIEDIIWQEKKNLETTINLQTKYPTGAVIRYFKTAETLFTLMYKRVKATRDFIEMANRDVFWYHAEKKLNTTRKKLDSAVKRCNGAVATEDITKYINDLKNKARRCSLELVARAEVNEREFEFVARALNKIYWKVEGCIGDAVRIDKPVTAHLRKRRSFLKLFKKMGKKFIEVSLPFLAGTAAGDAMQYGLSWLNGGDDAQKEKKCIDTNILDNTRINTQMLLYRAHDAIDLVNAAWLMEDTTININNQKLEVKPMQVCVRRKVEKLANLNKFRALLGNCGISEESIFTPDPKDEPVIPQYSKEEEETETDAEDEDDDDVSFESEIGSPLDLEVGPGYEVDK